MFIFRLSLPGRIVEDGREKAKFDIDKGGSHYYMTVTHAVAVKQRDLSCQFYGDVA